MNKLDAYVSAIELAIQALDSAFIRSNAAETVIPRMPLSERWTLPPAEREAAERAEIASYNVTTDHWGARLCLMSAFESLHGALRIISSSRAHSDPHASAWRDATARAAEASRLAQCAAEVLGKPEALPSATTPQPEGDIRPLRRTLARDIAGRASRPMGL